MPVPTNLAVARIIKRLEAARSDADAGGKDLALLAYMIDMALIEARKQLGGASRQ